MRGHARGVAIGVTALASLLLAGCTLPDGVDGDLTGSWAAMPEPVGFVPDAGVCHEFEHQETSTLADYEPIDCTEEHLTETVYVGEFDESVDRINPPSPGSSEWRDAFSDCDSGATEYLGNDFRYARLWLGVTVPSTEAWEGGSRWFRCDVVAYDNRLLFERTRSESLAGALTEGSDLLLGCFDVSLTDDDERIDEMTPISCNEPHHAEFVGVWQAPDGAYIDGVSSDSADQVHQGCREQVAEYVGVPVDGDLPFRTGTIADWMDEEDWDNGDRKFRCYLWLNGEELTESLAGAGTSGLPVR